jgi:hypothetical protein
MREAQGERAGEEGEERGRGRRKGETGRGGRGRGRERRPSIAASPALPPNVDETVLVLQTSPITN